MKILIDARNLGTKPSGIGMYAYNFIKALIEYSDYELYVIVDIIESQQIKELDANSRCTVLSTGISANKSLAVFDYFRKVKAFINDIKPDIFWEINNLAPVRIRNPYGKYIVTIHDMFPITMPEYFGKIYPKYFRYGIKKTINSVDGIIYNSVNTKNETEKFFPKSKSIDSFVSYIIIPEIPYVDVEPQDYYLFLGNLEKRKGVDILLDTFEKYVEKGGKRKLVVAGKEREKDIFTKIQKLSNKYSNFIYKGYADEDTRTRLYHECGCFLFPSRAEGFGMPLIEALQCGKDVIASNLDIFHELASDSIISFDLKDDGDDSDRLSDAMIKYDVENPFHSINKEKADYFKQKYGAQVLSCGLKDYFEQICL